MTNIACAIWRLVSPLGGHLGDPPFGCGEGVDPTATGATRAGAGCQELVSRPRHERSGAAGVGEIHPGVQRFARRGALAGTAGRGAELDERVGQLEPPRRAVEHRDALAMAIEVTRDESEGAQRPADGAGGPPGAGQPELLGNQTGPVGCAGDGEQ